MFVHNAFLMNQFFLSSSSSSSSCTQTSFLLHFTEKDFALCLQLLLHSATPTTKRNTKMLVVKKLPKTLFFLLQKSNPFSFSVKKEITVFLMQKIKKKA